MNVLFFTKVGMVVRGVVCVGWGGVGGGGGGGDPSG